MICRLKVKILLLLKLWKSSRHFIVILIFSYCPHNPLIYSSKRALKIIPYFFIKYIMICFRYINYQLIILVSNFAIVSCSRRTKNDTGISIQEFWIMKMFKNESGIHNDTILLLSKYIIIFQIRVWIIKDFKQVIRLWSNIVSKISLNNLHSFSLRFVTFREC